jgi:hypothetical protein
MDKAVSRLVDAHPTWLQPRYDRPILVLHFATRIQQNATTNSGKSTTLSLHARTMGATSAMLEIVASTTLGRSTPCALGGRSPKPTFTRFPSCRGHATRLRVSRASTARTTECVRVSALFRRQTLHCGATTVCIPAWDSAAGIYNSGRRDWGRLLAGSGVVQRGLLRR